MTPAISPEADNTAAQQARRMHAPQVTDAPLLVVDQVTRTYQLPREKLWSQPPKVHALQGVSFQMQAGRSMGIVGESGSGKSTLARLVMALEAPTSGSVSILGRDMASLDAPALRHARRDFQMVFQDPYGSLDPRQTVHRIVTEPLQAQGDVPAAQQTQQAREVLLSVGLRATDLGKYPHEFSGGQRQRIAIARALITRPRLIVADEPVSALDVSVQAQVLNLMQDLQAQFDVTYLLISHDLAVVDHLCADVAVIFQGRIVEQGAPQTLFRQAAHPYTQALLDAVPRMEPRRSGDPRRRTHQVEPRVQLPAACPYAHRCPRAQGICDSQRPELVPLADAGHRVACHFPQTHAATETGHGPGPGAKA
jgi:oligopeptide/dipeptide ABC transporter ATP-binding protein